MDIDIDFPTRFDPIDYFDDATRASMVKNGKLSKHPVGIYFQNIPVDNITNLAAIPYKEAEDLGFFKIDFLHLSLLDNFNSKEQIRKLANTEPDWKLLLSAEVVQKLFQIHRHYELIFRIKPTSIQELADCIALIRPSKRRMVDKYIQLKTEKDKESFRKILYAKPLDSKYHFKKPHAVAYSATIVLQLHLIKEGLL